MGIGQLTKLNTSNLLAGSTQAVAKLAIPKLSRQINADSLKWLDKLGSIGKQITSSINSGNLFELPSIGPNIFGIPAFSEAGETHHPVLNFEPDHDQDLNLSSVDMQRPTGTLRWASASNAAALATPPTSPDRAHNNGTPPSLPRRPVAAASLELGNFHNAEVNSRAGGIPPPLPPRKLTGAPRASSGSQAATIPPLPPRPPLPPTPLATPPMSPQQSTSTASQDSPGASLGGPKGAALTRRNAHRRASAPPKPPLPPKPTTRAGTLPADQLPKAPAQPHRHSTDGAPMIPDSLRPGLGWRAQSDPMHGNTNAVPVRTSSDIPDSLRAGFDQRGTRRASEPSNAIEARSRLAAAAATASSLAQRASAVKPSNTAPVRFTNLQAMQSIYRGEETGQVFGTQVKYLNDRERAAFKVTIKEGKVYDAAGTLFDTRHASTAFKENKGRAIFVMDAAGAMYISNEQTRGKFHHSSFFGGGPVSAAGDVRIENGVMTAISRNSGHYRPTSAQLNQAVSHLKHQGVLGVFVDENFS